MGKEDFKRQYEVLRAYSEDLLKQLDELRHGHIQIDRLNIDYTLPDEVRSYHHWLNRIFIWAAASLIGLIAVGFAIFADKAYELFHRVTSHNLLLAFIICPTGLVIVRLVVSKYFKGAEGSGIPQVVASLNSMERSKGLLHFKLIFGKIFGSALGLLSGASIGREGPTVQVGSILMRYFGKILRSPCLYSPRSLILAGGAAGVSAAFNAPIAGIVFAIEELSKSFLEKEVSVLLMAIVVAGLTALSISGQYFYFGEAHVAFEGVETLYSLPLGLISGVLGGLFSVLILRGTKTMETYSLNTALTWTFACGLGIAAIGYFTGGATFGTGYEQARGMLEGGGPTMTYYPLAKLASTVLSYLSGIPGGIFAPSLSVGAGLGHWFAEVISSPSHQAFVLVGMASFFSGVIRSPITAVIIVSEMTNNHMLLFPLLLSSLAAYGTSKVISQDSLYHGLANRYLGINTNSDSDAERKDRGADKKSASSQ